VRAVDNDGVDKVGIVVLSASSRMGMPLMPSRPMELHSTDEPSSIVVTIEIRQLMGKWQ
jgi:hypothetical protein